MANLHNSKTYQKGKIDMKNVLSKSQVIGFTPTRDTKDNYDTPSFDGVSDKVRDFLLLMCLVPRHKTQFELMRKYLKVHLGFHFISRKHFKDLNVLTRFVLDTKQFVVDE